MGTPLRRPENIKFHIKISQCNCFWAIELIQILHLSMCAAETKETLKSKKKRMEQARGGKKNITRTKKCFIVTYLRIFQGKRLTNETCGERGSNTRPSDLQSDALPTELSPLSNLVEIDTSFSLGKVYIYLKYK